MVEVLIPSNQDVAMAILEDDAPALIQPVEVLDSCDDRIGRIVREDVHPHWKSSPGLGGLRKQKLKADLLGRHLLGGRQGIVRRGRLGARIDIHHARITFLCQHIVVWD
jgi:hypothetical protein